jgi:3-oxoacyl-[acyl-carrier-protein] synthase II
MRVVASLSDSPIVITGMGLCSALGISVEETWRAVLAGRCGSGGMSQIESPLPPGKDGCEAAALPEDFESELPREARYLRWTILAALRDAGAIDRLPADSSRCAVMLGTTLHGIRAAGRFLRSGNYDELRHFLAGDTLRLAISGLDLNGGAATTCSACSSSLGSITLGVTLLQTNQADLVVAGGYDAVSEYVWAGFNSLRLVADGPLRPFARDRAGMKLGEGYGIVVMERADDARKRRAPVRAVVAGWGESADAHHLTQPHPAGEGASAAMRAALERAGVDASELDLIAAHATGTPDNDAAEFAALRDVLGERIADVPVVCFKTHLGHTLGGAGATELILSAMALRDGVLPPCPNVEASQIEFEGLRLSHGQAVKREIRCSLNTSLGFGGANTCVVLARSAKPQAATKSQRPREVWVTGMGVIVPGALGNDALVAQLNNPGAPAWERPPGSIEDADFEHLLNARRVRRMSPYVKLTLAAATIACRDAQLIDRPDLLAQTSALLGTTHGSSSYSYDYYAQIVKEGVLAANPMLFAEGVPNVGAAQLSLMLGLKSACQSIIGSRTAGLDALRLACLRISSGAAQRVIVGAGEESHFSVERAYEHCGLRSAGPSCPPFAGESGFRSGPGAVSLVLESNDSARERGAIPYAKIGAALAMNGDRETLPRTLAALLKALPASGQILCSANATWLDRAERSALSRAAPEASIGSAYDLAGELLSATPLLNIAAALLSGRLPNLARRREMLDRFTALCTDWTGGACAATLEPMTRAGSATGGSATAGAATGGAATGRKSV